MEAIKFRDLRNDDTDKIVQWRNSSEVLKWFINRQAINETIHMNWKRTMVDTGRAIQYIISYNEIDVGTVFIKDIDYTNKTCELGMFIANEDYRGKGLGKISIDYILDIAKNKGINTIRLRVLEENNIAKKLYDSRGFKFINSYIDDIINEKVIIMERKV